MLYIPEGFAHGMMALEDNTLLCYASGDDYSPQTDGGIHWNDPDIGVQWPIPEGMELTISEKDQKWDAFFGGRLVVLDEFHINAGFLEVIVVVGLHKISPGITKHRR